MKTNYQVMLKLIIIVQYAMYMEKLINVENDWDGEVDCPEVMGPHCGRGGCSSY